MGRVNAQRHTPGPWVMEAGDPEFREGYKISAPGSPHPLGDHYTREDNVVGACCSAGVYREADALLIAASPDLLEALEKLVANIDSELGVDDTEWLELNGARAAIAKAKGQKP